ncbi:hypothetical protein R1sor_011405 [Riccia sorocarpa]|uniref:Uncharacterized protein n=1 Tax=Riccia sorocarpa TaxID=122646 RepID=A0ABD3I2L8_9MARC
MSNNPLKGLRDASGSQEDPLSVSDAFVDRWKSKEPLFVQYYQDQWVPKLKEWVLAYRKHKRSNQNTTGAVERWHTTLKAHIRCSRMTKVMRKLSWLVVLLTSTIELYFWCCAELKYQGRIRNKVVEDQIVTVCVKAKSIPDSLVTTVELDGTIVRVFTSNSNPDTSYTVIGWATVDSRCTCSNECCRQCSWTCITETEIVKTLGRKAGSRAGGAENLTVNRELPLDLNEDPRDLDVPEEPQFHFPFDMNVDTFAGAALQQEEEQTTVEDIIAEAQRETNTTAVDTSALKVPNPLQSAAIGTTATELTRTKGWHEQMMDDYRNKSRKVQASQTEENRAVPLERIVKQKWPTFNEQFDGDALVSMLGQNKENSVPKKRRRTTVARTKIGGASGKRNRAAEPLAEVDTNVR